MSVTALARRLHLKATRANQRRLLVIAGDREAGFDAAFDAIDAVLGASRTENSDNGDDATVTVVSSRSGHRFERYAPERADELLGRTRSIVLLDCHEGFTPNVLGQVAGVVDGGGLFVLLTPPLADWSRRRDAFDESMAVPPFAVDDVGGRFRSRLVATLREHPGVGIVDVDAGGGDAIRIVREGTTDPPNAPKRRSPEPPPEATFPTPVYDRCLTRDQVRAVTAFQRLREPGNAVVLEADRGRGKSSAAGLAAGALASDGRDVLVTAPTRKHADELFARARTVTDELGDDPGATAGDVRFAVPADAVTLPGDPDVVFVDEAAALPVRTLERLLGAPAVGFCTTVHGYEGSGRGFSVRFRERLAESGLQVTELAMTEPIRYAPGDPVESWVFRALLLDASPAVEPAVADATPETCAYRELSPGELAADEHLLGEAFGLLVTAHYRTEPNDLARLLDAPNLSVHALLSDGHVASVALLAREGGLDEATRQRTYLGERIRGNMLPDVLTSQLRDPEASAPTGYRIARIATHHAVRSRGLGSRLLTELHERLGSRNGIEYLGVGYGATPELLRFWADNSYGTVHVSTTRNDSSGEYSALMLSPTGPDGRKLAARHAGYFRDRMRDLLSDALADLDPEVARLAIGACPADPETAAERLSERDWRVIASAAYGPGMYTAAPGAFRELATAGLLEPDLEGQSTDGDVRSLTPDEKRLLVRKVLQGAPAETLADELGYHSRGECLRALGRAYRPLVERFGGDAAREERSRYE
ncbi:tRNA(Met) C34 N-acetyltransferase TmcA [Halalkaliarchaeum sp. AArc-CO]|uniref:tRNA(Met) cytidine acetyltransferase TmcA n=1 Tax=unclassified Halalkaliarchaeum TaxID=2678344 RepID=UPI00217D8D18|nr:MULTISPECIES: tRNA(Met) cytidine acetyltransferase TmcA [unclassified Halalkaliarchaeum]MDR5674063.1 tRNA(Met) cytidine acetyltransferase TmcA [Halalkaliarchaeum sp. AArc-GB]UWG50793.1 tRNA(Met) C34 N-acetyltransferase TmcA [Halalkaliarchaeum sp. AArc-CO]